MKNNKPKTAAAPAAKVEKTAAAAPVIAPVKSRSQHAGYLGEVRKLLTGEGLSVAALCEKLKLRDRAARGAIDTIRAKEGYDALPRDGKVFKYKGLDGKGMPA